MLLPQCQAWTGQLVTTNPSLCEVARYTLLAKQQPQFAQCADTFEAMCKLVYTDTLVFTQFCHGQVIPYTLCLETRSFDVYYLNQLILLQHYGLLLDNACQDSGAALLLQVQDCEWSLACHPGSKHIGSTRHHARPSPSWAIPTMHSLSTVQIFELPSTASWRP